MPHGCAFFRHSHWVWRDRLSIPQVQRLHQRRLRVLRRKRDCTPPSSSHFRGGLLARLRRLRRRKDWHLSLPPHNAGRYFGGEGTGPSPCNVREYLGGGRTGLPPHTVGVYFMSKVEDNDELNILYSLTYRAVTVEGDQHIVTSAVRQSYKSFQGLDLWRTKQSDAIFCDPARFSCLTTLRPVSNHRVETQLQESTFNVGFCAQHHTFSATLDMIDCVTAELLSRKEYLDNALKCATVL